MTERRARPALIDSNVLVYAYDRGHPRHERCRAFLLRAVRGEVSAAISDQVVAEFVAFLTHPRAPGRRRPLAAARIAGRLLRSRYLACVSPTRRSLALALALIGRHRLSGPEVHDARLAGLVLAHRLEGIYTFDRGFRRFEADGVRALEP